ncbi:D-glycero-beta-D-manno-heptose-1,7-bisphosphate 7-phosphatase [bioreactor metagenome]|uniref:D-glycero-beta-D-manno-heptose-1,7-bisphosphate 7-phosphatase n=1 Tax=bioreactor metagenome TaxID=1076179 RepID=A0A645AVW4_9ZZZZ
MAAQGGRIDAVFFCPHADSELCSCRKPAPGLIEQIRDRYGVERGEMVAVGSTPSHLQAAAAAGVQQLHMICTGASAEVDASKPLPEPWPQGTRVHADLNAFVDFIAAAQEAKASAH